MAQTERQAQEARRVFAKKVASAEQRDAAYLIERRRIQKANDEKTARLKALRLAKEAAERVTAEAAAAEKAANPKRAASPKGRIKAELAPPQDVAGDEVSS
jgi:hypothetical protein